MNQIEHRGETVELTSIDLNLLVALDLLLEERSVRGAARRAHVTPSAMSHTLSRLRDLFGDEILVRAGHGMVPTPVAEALARELPDWLAHARRLLSRPERFEPMRLRRAFRLVCTDHVSAVLLPHVDAILRAEAPLVDLYEIPLLPESTERLRSGAASAAVGIFPEAPPEMQMRRLFSDGFCTVIREGHPRIADLELTLEAFLAESHLLVAPRGDSAGTIDQLLAARGLSRRVARTVPGFLAGLWQVADSDLLLTISRRLARAASLRLPIRILPTPLPVQDYTLMLAWHPRVESDVEERYFRSVLTRAAAALDAL